MDIRINTNVASTSGYGYGYGSGSGSGSGMDSESGPLEAGLMVVVAVDPIATLRPLFEDDPALEKTALELAPKMRKYVAFIRSVETTYKTSSTELPTPTQQLTPQSPQLPQSPQSAQLSQLSHSSLLPHQLGSQQPLRPQIQPQSPHAQEQSQSKSILDLEEASVTTKGRKGKGRIRKRRTNVHLNLVHTAPPTKSRYDTIDQTMCVPLSTPQSSGDPTASSVATSASALASTSASASTSALGTTSNTIQSGRKPVRVTNGHGLAWKELYLHTIMDAFASVSHVDERGYRPLLMPCLSSREMRRYDTFQARDRQRESSAFQKRLGVLAPLDPLTPLDPLDPMTTDEELRRPFDKQEPSNADACDYTPSEEEKDDIEFAELFTDEDEESECHLSTVISGVSFPLAPQTGSVVSEYFGGPPWRSTSPRAQYTPPPPPPPPITPSPTPGSIAPDSAGPSSWRPVRSPTMRSVRTNASKDASIPQFTSSNHNRRNSPTYHDYVTAINIASAEPSSPKSPTTTHLTSTSNTHATDTTQATSIMHPFSRVNSKPIFAPIAWNGIGGIGHGPSPVREEDSVSPLEAEEDVEFCTEDGDNSLAHLDLGGGISNHKSAKRRCAIHVRIWLELSDIQEPEDPRLFFEDLKLLRVMERNSDMQYLEKLKQANADRVMAWRKASAKAVLPSPPPTSFTSPFSFRRASLPAKRVRRTSLGIGIGIGTRRPSLPSSVRSGKSVKSNKSGKSGKSGRSGRFGKSRKHSRSGRLSKLHYPSTSGAGNTSNHGNHGNHGNVGSIGKASKNGKPRKSLRSVRRLSAFAKTHRQTVIEAITPPGSRRGSKTQTIYEANKMLTMVIIDEPTPKLTFPSLMKIWKRFTCRQPRPSISA